MDTKIVIITGAASGIGQETSRLFLKMGHHVVMSDKDEESLEKSEPGEGLNPDNFLKIRCDVSNEQDCKSLVEATIHKYGRLDILINNAGISMQSQFLELNDQVFRKLMDVNFWGTVYCTRYGLPFLLESKGSLVGITSIAGLHGLPGRSAYSASKYAVMGFLGSVRLEHYSSGLHVMTFAPGYTKTKIREKALTSDGSELGISPYKEGKMMSAQKVALKLYRAINRRARHVTLTINGKGTRVGNLFFPATLDKLYYKFIHKDGQPPF